MFFDSRELAILVWILIGLVLAASANRIRPSVIQVGKALVHPKLLPLWFTMLAYIGGLIWLLAVTGIWTTDLVGETLFWFLGPAIILFSRFDQATKDPKFLRRALLSILELTILIEFVINLYPLSFLVEFFLLVPVLTFLGVTAAFAALKPEYRQAKVLLDWILTLAGFALLTYAVVQIVRDVGGFATAGHLSEFVVPIIMTVAFVPYVYAVAVLMAYGTLSIQVGFRLRDRKLKRYAMWRLFRGTLFRLKYIRGFAQRYPALLGGVDSREEVANAATRVKSEIKHGR